MERITVARLVAPGKMSITTETVDPCPAEGEAVVRVKVVGICGTDVHIFRGQRSDVVLPRIMGHELSGQVTAIGRGVENVRPGDRVVLDPVIACGHCKACRNGYGNVCAQVKCYGVQMDGGLRDLITVKAKTLHVIPDGVGDLEAALVEPFSIASNILNRARARAGEDMVILGAGTIGLAILQAAKGMGLRVLIGDISARKVEKAQRLHADVTVNTSRDSFAEAVRAFAPEGADVLVDAVGVTPLLEQVIELCGPRSRVVVIGFDDRPMSVPPVRITKSEISLIGSRMNAHRFPEALDWFAKGSVDPMAMVDRVFSINDAQQAFDLAASNPDITKILLRFDEK